MENNDSERPDYQDKALRTMSKQFHGNLVTTMGLLAAIRDVIHACEVLDAYKKTMFYAKPFPFGEVDEGDSLAQLQLTEQETMLIHGMIGKATEAGEGLENVLQVLETDEPINVTNVIEEVGDGQWYDAITCHAIGTDFETVQRKNIAKLQARYPDKFTSENANQRDLFAEGEALKTA